MLRSVTVENFRSFVRPAKLDIKPITVLLGKNSAGKSTLARLFPLFRQTVENQYVTPILWESEAIDFGSISDVLPHGREGDHVKISFEIDGSNLNRGYDRRAGFTALSQVRAEKIIYKVCLKDASDATEVSSIEIDIDGHNVVLKATGSGNVRSISVGGKELVGKSDGAQLYINTKQLFPELARPITEVELRSSRNTLGFYPKAQELFQGLLHKATSKIKRDYIARQITYVPRRHTLEYLKRQPNIVTGRLKDEELISAVADASLVNDLPRIIRFVEAELRPAFRSMGYLGPVRASGDRFYRMRELSVQRIDAKGENLAMYLRSLSEEDMAAFNDMLVKAAGIMVRVESSGPGHVSLRISGDDGRFYENIADVGFGFTQLLPIVAELHAATRRRPMFGNDLLELSVSHETIVAIEQPELHLHPALQGNIADLFAAAIQSKFNRGLKLVVETHSETFLGRLGVLVAKGAIPASSVSVNFVEKSSELGESVIRVEGFDSDGLITNWPSGFFSPDIEE